MKNLAVFASGSGTNFQAIIDDGIGPGVKISLLVCDKENAFAIARALKAGIDTFVFDAKEFNAKRDYEKMILRELKNREIDLIALAGYMRLIGEKLLSVYDGRIVNIHPSLLPAFKGKNAIGQAIAHGVKVMGVSVHFVDSGMDTGKIIAQQSFDVVSGMSKKEIENNVHAIEHVLYPKVLKQLLSKGVL